MKKRIKIGKDSVKTVVVFETYKLADGQQECPECHRPFKEHDIKRLADNGKLSCPKCGAKLEK